MRSTCAIACFTLVFSLIGPAGLFAQQGATLPTPSASSSDIAYLATLRGMALPVRQVTLNAPVDGTLKEIFVEEGQTVKADQSLARMDDGIQKAMVAAAELKATDTTITQKTELELKEAAATLEQVQQAYQQQAVRDWELRRAHVRRDIAEVALDQAKRQVEVAGAELQLERERLARFELRAPWDGYVVRVAVDPGATLSRSDAIMQIVDLSELEAEIYLPADMFDQVQQGRVYQLQAQAPVSRTLSGKLKIKTQLIDPGSQHFRCVFTIANVDLTLPGGFAVQLIWPQTMGQ